MQAPIIHPSKEATVSPTALKQERRATELETGILGKLFGSGPKLATELKTLSDKVDIENKTIRDMKVRVTMIYRGPPPVNSRNAFNSVPTVSVMRGTNSEEMITFYTSECIRRPGENNTRVSEYTGYVRPGEYPLGSLIDSLKGFDHISAVMMSLGAIPATGAELCGSKFSFFINGIEMFHTEQTNIVAIGHVGEMLEVRKADIFSTAQ